MHCWLHHSVCYFSKCYMFNKISFICCFLHLYEITGQIIALPPFALVLMSAFVLLASVNVLFELLDKLSSYFTFYMVVNTGSKFDTVPLHSCQLLRGQGHRLRIFTLKL